MLLVVSKHDDEKSPSGTPIIRHTDRDREFRAAVESTGAEHIERHFARYFGEPTSVFHEIVSDTVHLDVHIIPPRPERDCWTLFTTGMSDLPMSAPPEAAAFAYAELVISLPREWRIDRLQLTPPPPDLERWYWPIYWLKNLARLPHEYDTWLGIGHTIPNGDPAEPFALGTKLCGWLLLPPINVPEEALQIALPDGRTVHLLAMHALYAEEMAMKLNKGLDALIDALDRAGIAEVLAPERAPVARRKLFGLF